MNTASAVIEAPAPELTRRIPLPSTTEALNFPVIWNMSPLLDDPQYDDVAFTYAFEKTVGRPPNLVPRRRSRTDPAVSLDMLVRNGVPEQKARRLLGVFLPRLSFPASEGHRFRLDERSLAPFREAVAGLAVRQTVICPEVRPVALAKLAAAQLTGHIDVGLAAFGSDHIDLDALPGVVRSRTRARKDRA